MDIGILRSSLAIAFLAMAPVISFFQANAMPDQLVSETYQQRVGELLEILKGKESEEEFFAHSFLGAVPLPQFRSLTKQLRAQYGQPLAITRVIPASDMDGTIEIAYERATLAFRMVIDQAQPKPVIGLLVTGAKVRDDGLTKIVEEFQKLPGSAGFEIARIDSADRQVVASHNADQQFAIGSTFKLYVLAELNRNIRSGQRNWDDVARINQKSLPSGVLQNWPDGAPLTLQSLATLMINISDNTATDLLISELGRSKIDNMVRRTGHSNPSRTIPILTTLELFALKMPGNDDIRRQFTGSTDQMQARLLDAEKDRLGRSSVSIANLANKPKYIEDIEWFASPADISRLVAYLVREADPTTRSIMAISSDIGPGDRARWSYIGSKGGSEPGVISYAYLAISKSGQTYAVSGSWNDTENPVDGAKFKMLMNRLLNLTAGMAG